MSPSPALHSPPVPRGLRLAAAWALLLCATPALRASPSSAFESGILPVLREFCFDCHGDGSHKGEVSLDAPEKTVPRGADPKFWLAIWRALDSQLMPPPEKPQPSPELRARIKAWIEESVFHVDPANPDPGHNTLRRLNREEYHNTILDLLGVDFPVEHRFPPDDSGNGFDNNADVLSLSPLLMEKYLEAAKAVIWQWGAAGPSGRGLFPVPVAPPSSPEAARALRRELLKKFALLAFRRPAEPQVLEKINAVCDGETDFNAGLRMGMYLVLSSPRFLFRVEPPPLPRAGEKFALVDEFSLASRLSYFLWNSCPDARLLDLAGKNALRSSLGLELERMLKDARFKRFTHNFAGQWLQTRDTASVPISVRAVLEQTGKSALEKAFNSKIRGFLRQETEMFVHHIFAENLPVEQLLTADYTFLNKPLAEFYGIPGVNDTQFSRVPLPAGSGRVGILTHGSFLMISSNPTRTSPVKRGLFVLENLLGTPTPPPPPNIPPLEEQKTRTHSLSMRALMEMHREDPLCASCHARLDPIGLALEDFNAIGQRRATSGSAPVDTAGRLATGETFSSVAELAHILSTSRRGDFYRRLSEKLLTYAAGRSLDYYDTPTVNGLVKALGEANSSPHALIRAVIESAPFQKQRAVALKVAIDAGPRGPHTFALSGLPSSP